MFKRYYDIKTGAQRFKATGWLKTALGLIGRPFVYVADRYRWVKKEHILVYYAFDFIWRFSYFIFFAGMATWGYDIHGWIKYPVIVLYGMIYTILLWQAKVFKDYSSYLYYAKCMDEGEKPFPPVTIVSWKEVRRIISGKKWTNICARENLETVAFFAQGNNPSNRFVMYRDKIMSGQVLIESNGPGQGLAYNHGIITGRNTVDVFSYAVYPIGKVVYVLSFFGWLLYIGKFNKNLRRANTFSNISARLYGENVYRKLVGTKEENTRKDPWQGKSSTSSQYNISGLHGTSGIITGSISGWAISSTYTPASGSGSGATGLSPVPSWVAQKPMIDVPIKSIGNPSVVPVIGEFIFNDVSARSQDVIGVVSTDDSCKILTTEVGKLQQLYRTGGVPFGLLSYGEIVLS